ncbi:DUF1453 family protein [Sphingomonas naasensis]|uniref:DUF1453 family protein n=2 Tax=Sphingomonas naasensis TaxID=1344951 RepID=A0A4S1WNA3_9SPHN|nr:DUF1453 family protein [Sphingomonas naasensis]
MNPAHAPSDWVRYAIPVAVIAVVMAFRLRSVGRARPLKIERLWIVPALYIVIATVTFQAHPPIGLAWLWCLAALAAGIGLGWQRGRMMRIEVDPETHAISQRTSPAALLLILGLIVVRSAARNTAQFGGPALDVMTVTDVLIAFALGLLATQRLEMWLRARRLLAAARAL